MTDSQSGAWRHITYATLLCHLQHFPTYLSRSYTPHNPTTHLHPFNHDCRTLALLLLANIWCNCSKYLSLQNALLVFKSPLTFNEHYRLILAQTVLWAMNQRPTLLRPRLDLLGSNSCKITFVIFFHIYFIHIYRQFLLLLLRRHVEKNKAACAICILMLHPAPIPPQ